MKTIGSIQIEYRQVMDQANKLGDCAEDLARLQRQIDMLVSDLKGGWEGESANLYFQKCMELSAKIKKSQNNLEQTANVIRKSARAYRDAEMEAIKIAQN